MFEPCPACFQRGLRSDRHGVTERDPTLAFSRPIIDPGDLPQDRLIPEHHPRIISRSHDGPGQTVYDWRHYLAVVQRKPGALRNGAPFVELPEAFRTLQQHLLKKPGGDREMVDILALVLQHDEQAVLSAVDMALTSGVPTKTHVLKNRSLTSTPDPKHI